MSTLHSIANPLEVPDPDSSLHGTIMTDASGNVPNPLAEYYADYTSISPRPPPTDSGIGSLASRKDQERIVSTLRTGDGAGGWQRQGLEVDWEAAWDKEKKAQWRMKVQEDLQGWRGGNGSPRSTYSPVALPEKSHYNTPVTGVIGRDLPKEILRVERDWSGGEVCQFETSFPMELDKRVNPAQFNALITEINTHLQAAYSTRAAILDNAIAIMTWWTSLWFRPGNFEIELRKVEQIIQKANEETWNPAGLNVLSPREVALQFLEIEYVAKALLPFGARFAGINVLNLTNTIGTIDQPLRLTLSSRSISSER